MKMFVGGTMLWETFDDSQMFFKADTLTDSSLEFSIEEQEIRAGRINGLIGKFFHSPKVELKLSNACFDLNWYGACVGVKPEFGAETVITEKVKVDASGKGKVVGEPVAYYEHGVIGWARVKDSETYQTVVIDTTTKEFTMEGITEPTEVCIDYFYDNPNAEVISIPANIAPSVLSGIGYANLYSSDDKTSRSLIGRLVFKAKRIQLAPNFSIALTSSGVAKQDINASLLVYNEDTTSCDMAEGGKYIDIQVELFDRKWYDDVNKIAASPTDVTLSLASAETEELIVNAIHTQHSVSKPKYSELTFTSADTNKVTVSADGIITPVAEGTTTVEVKITDKPDVKATVNVTVEA